MDYLNAGGKQRPFRFSWRALRKLAAKLELKRVADLDAALANLEFDHIPYLILIGIEEGYRKAGQPCDVTADDVENWLDEDFGIMQDAMELVGQQMESAVEKKMTANKSKK